MTLRIISKIRTPYGGQYTWKDPMLPKSQMLAGPTWDILLSRAKEQRFANGIAMGLNFEDEVEKDVCRDFPGECMGWDPNMPRPQSLTMMDVLRGTELWANQRLKGKPMVSQDEANARAKICASCTLNVTLTKRCGSCMDLEKLAGTMISDAHTPYDDSLKSCSICHCYTRIAVWVPLDNQCAVVTASQKEQFSRVPDCWKQCP